MVWEADGVILSLFYRSRHFISSCLLAAVRSLTSLLILFNTSISPSSASRVF